MAAYQEARIITKYDEIGMIHIGMILNKDDQGFASNSKKKWPKL